MADGDVALHRHGDRQIGRAHPPDVQECEYVGETAREQSWSGINPDPPMNSRGIRRAKERRQITRRRGLVLLDHLVTNLWKVGLIKELEMSNPQKDGLKK